MQLSIDTTGFIETSKRLKVGALPALSRAVFKVANKMETTAKRNLQTSVYASPKPKSPFSRTGKALQSISVEQVDPLQSRVRAGVNYAKYLETGTGIYNGRQPYWTTFGGILPRPIFYKGMRARPFWKPAIETTQRAIPAILKAEIDKL